MGFRSGMERIVKSRGITQGEKKCSGEGGRGEGGRKEGGCLSMMRSDRAGGEAVAKMVSSHERGWPKRWGHVLQRMIVRGLRFRKKNYKRFKAHSEVQAVVWKDIDWTSGTRRFTSIWGKVEVVVVVGMVVVVVVVVVVVERMMMMMTTTTTTIIKQCKLWNKPMNHDSAEKRRRSGMRGERPWALRRALQRGETLAVWAAHMAAWFIPQEISAVVLLQRMLPVKPLMEGVW